MSGSTLASGGNGGTVIAGGNVGRNGGTAVARTTIEASGTVDATAEALVGRLAPSFLTMPQSVATIDGAPQAASVNAILAGNGAIAAGMANAPVKLAIEQVGGSYSPGGAGTQTATDTLDFTANLTTSDLTHDLALGFYGGNLLGSGNTDVTLDIVVGNRDVFSENLTGAAATKLFTDQTANLGPLSALAPTGTLDVKVVFGVTADAASSGFHGGTLVAV